jgi:hypothetical protein
VAREKKGLTQIAIAALLLELRAPTGAVLAYLLCAVLTSNNHSPST